MPGRTTLPLIASVLAFNVLSIADPGVARGQEFCSEPVAPYCVDKDSEFDSMVMINRCEEDLKDYTQQLDEYEQCIKGQLKGMRGELSQAKQKLEEARKKF